MLMATPRAFSARVNSSLDDRAQVDPAAGHRDVRDVGRPDLIGPVA